VTAQTLLLTNWCVLVVERLPVDVERQRLQWS